MKQNVKFSMYCLIMTAVVAGLFVAGIFALLGQTADLIIFCIMMGGGTVAGLYYCPKSLQADKSGVTLHRLLSPPKTFKYDAIQGVDTCYPSAGGLRLCASGGYFGYWGYFTDIMIGSYFGYYGSRSHCIAVKLKDGKQYVLGCDNPVTMVNYIKSQMEDSRE